MKQKDIKIKKRQSLLPLYIGFCVIMLGIGIFCLFLPYIAPYKSDFTDKQKLLYLILGGIGTVYFAFLSSYLAFQLISPPTAILIKAAGITDFTLAGCGAGFIPRDAIISLKVFGIKKKLFLGIKISDDYVGDLGLKNAAKREIQMNISSGMPAIIIRQNDINIPIRTLLKLIVDKYSSAPEAKPASLSETDPETSKTKEQQPIEPPLAKQIFSEEAVFKKPQAIIKEPSITVLTIDEDDKPEEASNDALASLSAAGKNGAAVKSVDELLNKLLHSEAEQKPISLSDSEDTNEQTPTSESDASLAKQKKEHNPIESDYFSKLFSSKSATADGANAAGDEDGASDDDPIRVEDD